VSSTDPSSVAQLAQQGYDAFERATRPDSDETYTRMKDDAPYWLEGLVRDAHGEFLPNDWRYDSIRSALGFIADNDLDADDLDDGAEWCDQNVDTYTGARLAWLASDLRRPGYCDEALDEFGGPADARGGIVAIIGLGQYMESGEIWASVVESLRIAAEEQIVDDAVERGDL
jgi:hypothetical protein